MKQVLNYKGYEIFINQEMYPINPFEDWDCLPQIRTTNRDYWTVK